LEPVLKSRFQAYKPGTDRNNRYVPERLKPQSGSRDVSPLTTGAVQTKYIFVTGGVTSSLGKGIFSASLGLLLEDRGLRVTIQKFDPYINVDPGTMNPYEHGEVYVTDDGAETDLDLGHYERFLDIQMTQDNNVTTGQVYWEVISKEREGAYLGKTVQVVPHIIDEIKRRICNLGDTGEYDVVITEIGGTVGDIESQPYLEAIRQMRRDRGIRNTCEIHLTLVPYLAAAGELKTKPTQHSVKMLLSYGMQPDILACRSEHPLNDELRAKIALFCNVESEAVIEARDAESIYEVPFLLQEEGLDDVVCRRLHLGEEGYPESGSSATVDAWRDFVSRYENPDSRVRIALVGKYVEHNDAYKSISESFVIAGAHLGVEVEVIPVLSDDITEKNVAATLKGVSGILVAPGFGERGIEGKIQAIGYVRKNHIPFFGICLGLQCAVIEFARNVCGLEDAHSTEFNEQTPYAVIDIMEDQREISEKGGTMRLGGYECRLVEGTRASDAYGELDQRERHRHRYEVNNALKHHLQNHGMIFSGINPDRNLVEIIELPEHPWFVGVQFHPEFQTRVQKPHPLFRAFVDACRDYTLRTDSSVDVKQAVSSSVVAKS
jgi:CTP synthase